MVEDNGTCPEEEYNSKKPLRHPLKRVAFAKINLKIELFYHSLKECLVGIYDTPERDPREHVISIAFLCKIVEGETKPGVKVDAVKSFSEAETKNWKLPSTTGKLLKKPFLCWQT